MIVNKAFLFGMLLAIPTFSLASSGVSPFWLYQTADGEFLARMSDKAEQDDYEGLTQGVVKSKLFVYKMFNGNIPNKPSLVTTSTCVSNRNEPESIQCSNAGGPFTGTIYKPSSSYSFEAGSKGRLKPKLISGESNQAQKQAAMLLIGEYVKSEVYKNSYGLIGFGVFKCIQGCNSISTPLLMIEVHGMGD